MDDDKVTEVSQNSTIRITDDMISAGLGSGQFSVYGKRLGLAQLSFYLHNASTDAHDEGAELVYDGYRVIVLREESIQDTIYTIGIIVFAITIYLGFGCQINLSVVWSTCRRPVAVLIGLSCQYIVMPLVSYFLLFCTYIVPLIVILIPAQLTPNIESTSNQC